MTRLGVDLSNYSGLISDWQVTALKEAGVEYAIVGTQKATITTQQIGILQAGGIDVPAVYCFLYWDLNDAARVSAAQQFLKPVWLDCENVAHPMPSAAEIVNQIVSHVDYLDADCAGIYTGSWWWLPYTSNSPRFKGLPLWHAAYQSRPESLHLPTPYGGWDRATIWQYSNGGIAGVNADLDVMEDVPVPQPIPATVKIDGIGFHFDDGTDIQISAADLKRKLLAP